MRRIKAPSLFIDLITYSGSGSTDDDGPSMLKTK